MQLIRQIIGVYQLLASILGIYFWVDAILNPMFNVFWLLYTVIGLALIILGIVAGVQCLKSSVSDLHTTFVNQMLQLVSFSLLGFTFSYVSGFGILITIDLSQHIGFIGSLRITSIEIGKAGAGLMQVSLNLIPLAILAPWEFIKKYWTANSMDLRKAQ